MSRTARWKPLLAAVVAGLALVFALFVPALAQPPADDAPPKGTPAPVPTDKPASEFEVQGGSAPDFTKSYYTARGAHAGETATYTLVVANSGDLPANGTEVTAPLPLNASYVSGSAAVQGGGAFNLTAGVLTWQGNLGPAQSITISYQVVLPTLVGDAVYANATIYAPGLLGALTLNTVLRIQAPSGGPDAFGYTYKDSFAPGGPTFSWVPTTTPASRLDFGILPADDVFTGPVPLTFPFKFYSGTYTQAFVSTNGLITFGSGDDENISQPFPTTGNVNNAIACLWGDHFVADQAQGVWLEIKGSEPNRTAVFTFRLVYFGASDAGVPPILFQVILSEGTNRIKCQFAQTTGPNNGSGSDSGIGTENAAGHAGLQYFLGGYTSPAIIGPVENNLAIEFVPNGLIRPLLTTSTLVASHNVHPGDTLTYTLAISNSGNAPANSATVSSPIAPGTTFVPGSGQVVGGGVLNASAAGVDWSGAIAVGAQVTITYRVQLATTLGQVITSTATINDPQAATPVVLTNGRVRILPPPSGGPDTFNYTFKDSYAPGGPTFSWVPTTTPASLISFGGVPADDTYASGVPIGFSFVFYGHAYTQLAISTNGLVSFGTGSPSNHPEPIPTPAGETDNFAACFWSDLIVQDGLQGVWVETSGSPPNRRTVITFRVSHFETSAEPPALFQMILAETSNTIKCQYAFMPDRDDLSGGRRTTIGLENADGTSGLQYHHTPEDVSILGPLENGLAILFVPGVPVPSLSASSKTASPVMHPGNQVAYTIVISNNSAVAASAVSLNDPFPPGASYVGGSAAVQGGGTVGTNGSAVTWSGSLAAGSTVTVTFAAILPASGQVVNTATITDPQATGPVVRTALTPLQPPMGLGVGPLFYRYLDSYVPGITFSWVPTTGASLKLALIGTADTGFGVVPLAFPFTYYGHVFTRTLATTNGLVLFNDQPDPGFTVAPIPTAGGLDNFAACLWEDQVVASAAQGIWYETVGLAPNRSVVITFLLQQYDSPNAQYLYQLLLIEGTNNLKCQYAGVPGGGANATVGLEGPAGVTGVQYFTKRQVAPFIGPLEAGLAILFQPAFVQHMPVLGR
jgi:uncharacterized repeat protein (TIGR01451 family)